MVTKRESVNPVEKEEQEQKKYGFCEQCGLVEIEVKFEKVHGMNLPHKYCKKCGRRIY